MTMPPRRQECLLAAALIDAPRDQLPWERRCLLTKRDCSSLTKWCDRDWWTYGVTIRSGWVTAQGWEPLRALAARLRNGAYRD